MRLCGRQIHDNGFIGTTDGLGSALQNPYGLIQPSGPITDTCTPEYDYSTYFGDSVFLWGHSHSDRVNVLEANLATERVQESSDYPAATEYFSLGVFGSRPLQAVIKHFNGYRFINSILAEP